jgi:hypothetical protein
VDDIGELEDTLIEIKTTIPTLLISATDVKYTNTDDEIKTIETYLQELDSRIYYLDTSKTKLSIFAEFYISLRTGDFNTNLLITEVNFVFKSRSLFPGYEENTIMTTIIPRGLQIST